MKIFSLFIRGSQTHQTNSTSSRANHQAYLAEQQRGIEGKGAKGKPWWKVDRSKLFKNNKLTDDYNGNF